MKVLFGQNAAISCMILKTEGLIQQLSFREDLLAAFR
jgi:hypothetical protein